MTDALINLKELDLSVEKFEVMAYDFFQVRIIQKSLSWLTLYYQFEEINKFSTSFKLRKLQNIS